MTTIGSINIREMNIVIDTLFIAPSAAPSPYEEMKICRMGATMAGTMNQPVRTELRIMNASGARHLGVFARSAATSAGAAKIFMRFCSSAFRVMGGSDDGEDRVA